MKILVLSCNTGEGHNAAGRAIVEWAEKMGHEAVMEDMMSCWFHVSKRMMQL